MSQAGLNQIPMIKLLQIEQKNIKFSEFHEFYGFAPISIS